MKPRIPIIAFAPHPWSEPEWMNRQQILSRLGARGWPIIYSTGALDIWDRHKSDWQHASWLGQFQSLDNVITAHPGRILPRWQKIKTFDHLAIAQHSQWIRAKVASNKAEVIAMLFHPHFFPYTSYLKPCKIIFHAYDAYSEQTGWDHTQQALMEQLVQQASLITASSPAIARSLPDLQRARVLPNGANVEMFENAIGSPEPYDLIDIPHPRIGYTGAINRKVDLPLVIDIATQRPNWQWVFIGRVEESAILADAALASAYQQCLQLSNVHFLGQKDRYAVPAYMASMDINAMCYRQGGVGWWNAVYPLKLHEYLATGKPVISVDLEVVRDFDEVVTIAYTASDWINKLSAAIEYGGIATPAERIAVAKENSWDRRVDQLEGWLIEMLEV